MPMNVLHLKQTARTTYTRPLVTQHNTIVIESWTCENIIITTNFYLHQLEVAFRFNYICEEKKKKKWNLCSAYNVLQVTSIKWMNKLLFMLPIQNSNNVKKASTLECKYIYCKSLQIQNAIFCLFVIWTKWSFHVSILHFCHALFCNMTLGPIETWR